MNAEPTSPAVRREGLRRSAHGAPPAGPVAAQR